MQEQFQYPIAKSPKEAKMEIKYIYPQSHTSCNKHNVFFYKREPKTLKYLNHGFPS
jgi:hypothetical protein